jgi:hypothetical protein
MASVQYYKVYVQAAIFLKHQTYIIICICVRYSSFPKIPFHTQIARYKRSSPWKISHHHR